MIAFEMRCAIHPYPRIRELTYNICASGSARDMARNGLSYFRDRAVRSDQVTYRTGGFVLRTRSLLSVSTSIISTVILNTKRPSPCRDLSREITLRLATAYQAAPLIPTGAFSEISSLNLGRQFGNPHHGDARTLEYNLIN
jgi:hypothetical protein